MGGEGRRPVAANTWMKTIIASQRRRITLARAFSESQAVRLTTAPR